MSLWWHADILAITFGQQWKNNPHLVLDLQTLPVSRVNLMWMQSWAFFVDVFKTT